MLTEDQTKDIEFTKQFISDHIKRIVEISDKVKHKLETDILFTIIHLKIFSAYMAEQKVSTIEDAMKFMNDMGGIIKKIDYVSQDVNRFLEAPQSKS